MVRRAREDMLYNVRVVALPWPVKLLSVSSAFSELFFGFVSLKPVLTFNFFFIKEIIFFTLMFSSFLF